MMMLDQTGARREEALREHPAFKAASNVDRLLRGIIKADGVSFKNQNGARQTLVDIALLGGYPDITGVPIATTKANYGNGEEWTPQPGDAVLVQFINGNFWEPIVTGYLSLADDGGSNIQADSDEVEVGQLRHRLACNGTDIVIDPDGNRIKSVVGYEDVFVANGRDSFIGDDDVLEVEKNRTTDIGQTETITIGENRSITIEGNDTLNVTGNGTINIHGNVTVHIYGTAGITVDGDTTVTSPNVTVVASTKVKLTTPTLEVTGNVTAGGDITATGEIKDAGGSKTMSGMRTVYNSHTHHDNSHGAETNAPSQAQ